MSDTIFLDLETRIERTVFVDVRNTSDKDMDVKSLLVGKLQEKGYAVTNTPSEAFISCKATYALRWERPSVCPS